MDNKQTMAGAEQQQIPLAGAEAVDELIVNEVSTRVVRRNYKAMGFWLWAPAVAQPFRTLMWALEDLAVERKTDLGPASQVTRVRLARYKSSTRIYIYPTDWNDSQGIEIRRLKNKSTMNFYKFLSEAGMLVETGYAERFSSERAGSDSPVGPALAFDLACPMDRKVVKKPAKIKKNNTVNEQAAGADY